MFTLVVAVTVNTAPALRIALNGATANGRHGYLDVPVCDLVVVQVFQPLQDLPCVEADGGLVVLEGAPLGPEQR